jgi:hypothetical protein
MRSRYTSNFPKLWKFTVVPFVILFFTIPIGALDGPMWKVSLSAAIILALIELIGIFLKMPLSMLLRAGLKTFRKYAANTRGTLATPVNWRKKHGPFVMVSILLSTIANADYNVADSMMFERQWSKNHVGMEAADKVRASCDECPLGLALENVVPDLFNVSIDSTISEDIEISFNGEKPWGEFLQDIVREASLSAEMIRYNNMIVISKAGGPGDVGIFYTNLAGANSAYYETKTFRINKGDSFKSAMKRWAKREKWDIIVDIDNDINFSTSSRFEGTLEEAVYQLFSAMKKQGMLSSSHIATSPLNTTILISDKKER